MATYDDIATNRHILDIANGIRAVTRTTEEMTIPEMSERLTNIRVVEHREVEVSLGNSNLVVSLGMYQQDVKHLFIVTPKTSADAIILQRVKPEIELNYEAETGELTMSYQTPVDSLVTLLVIDLLLANNATNEGFLITQGGGGSIEPYNPDRAYELGEMFLYNKGTEENPNYVVGITIEAHEAEAYNINHSQVLATQIREEQDEPYIDLLDLARQFNEGFISLGESLEEHISDKTNPHEVTKSQVGLGNVDNTADINKPISSVQQTALDSKVDKILGYGLSKNDYSDDEKAKVEQNAEERHTHTNKDILDNTTASYTATEKTKLSGVEDAAQVNIIEQIKVNGVAKEVVAKVVDIAMPTRIDNLEDTTDTAPISRASKDASGNTISTTYSKVADIVNDLLSDNTDKPLSAYQGKVLNDNKATKLSIPQWHVPYRDLEGTGEPNTSRLATMTSPLPEAILIRDAEGKATFVGGTSANQGIVKSQLDSAIATTAKLESDNTFTASNNFTHANGLKIGTNVTLKYNSSTSSLEIVVT